MSFYVHIVESLAPEELLHDFVPGRALTKYLRLCGVPYQYNNVVDIPSFTKALDSRIIDGINDFGVPPILHLGMHGFEHGIQLTTQRATGSYYEWSQLSQFLLPIHRYVNNQLIVCMSSCSGIYGQAMANQQTNNEVPFSSLLGFASTVDWRDLALGYSVFYRRFQGGGNAEDIIEAVKLASGKPDFGLVNGQLAYQAYENVRIQQGIDDLRRTLSQLRHNINLQQTN